MMCWRVRCQQRHGQGCGDIDFRDTVAPEKFGNRYILAKLPEFAIICSALELCMVKSKYIV